MWIIAYYTDEVKVRNTDLMAKELLGINIDKFFMPLFANITGTQLSIRQTVSAESGHSILRTTF